MIIAFVALVLVGPDKLPETMHKVGSFWRDLKDRQAKLETSVRESMPNLPSTTELARMARSPVTLLNKLADFDAKSNQPIVDPGAAEVREFDDSFPEDRAAPTTPASVPTAESTKPRDPEVGFGDPSLN